MQQNRKIIIRRIGSSFRDSTEIVPEPWRDPGPGELLIRHQFAGVNGVYDQMMCLDRVEHTRVIQPADTGVEAVGIVEACGSDVEGFENGSAVATMTAGTGYRDWQVCKASDAIAIPAASRKILALIPSGVSAMVALEQVGEMRSGETVCITAATGGLGNVMTQLAVNAGNHVVAICGGDEKAARLTELGVARVIQYKTESVTDVLSAEYSDRIDLAMDSVGGELFDALADNLSPHGRLVICGFTSDRVPTATVEQQRIYTKLYWKAASIRGFMNYRYAEYADDARRRLLEMLDAGSIDPLVDPTEFMGLESIADAVEHLLAGRNVGKVIADLRRRDQVAP
ncbi:MAG: zinc-binding dehydrogenase [Woeseiaceae bacterium]